MKYTFLFNQAGIVDAGLADKTDFNDWAVLEYIAEWQVHGSACMQGGHVWLDYRHLLDEMPMLSVRTKSGVSNRVSKLRGLGLLSSFLDDAGRLFVRVTDLYCRVVRFRGESPKKPDAQRSVDPVQIHERPVHENERAVQIDERAVHENERLLNNHRINNQEQTKLLAGACATGSFADDEVFEQALQWAQFFIASCGYPLHVVQTAKTIPLFAEWVKAGVCVGDMRQAMAACHAWNGDRVPDSPVIYRKFLQSIFDERKRLADEAVFAERPGGGRNRDVEDWAKVPKADDALWPWAKLHGYPGPGSKTYRDYRSYLYQCVEKEAKRRKEAGG